MTHKPEHLILARHGRAEHNEIKRYMNDAMYDSLPPEVLEREVEHHPLTPEGILQAKALGHWIAKTLIEVEGLAPNRFYVSPTARTMQTAGYASRVIEAHQPGLKMRWVQDRNLRETHKGNLEQLRRLPDYDPSGEPRVILPTSELYRRTDGGESIYETMTRWDMFRHKRREELSGAVGLKVTHGYFMGAVELAMEAEGINDHDALELFKDRSPDNCNVVHYTNVEPETGEVADTLRWVRAVVPYQTSKGYTFDWKDIGPPTAFSSDQLLEAGNRYDQLLEHDAPSELDLV